MSHIDDLQHDVLHLIIQYGLENPVILPPRGNDAHIAVTHVSRTWRNIALSDPRLWDTFSFSNRSFSTRQKFMDIFDTLLKRSKPRPLSFIIVTDSVWHTRGLEGASSVRMEDLVYGSGRIGVVQDILGRPLAPLRHIHFIISNAECSGFLENVPFSDFSAIEVVDEYFLKDADFSRPSLHPCKDDTLVRVVVTKGISLMDVQLPWARMTRLDFEHTLLGPDIVLTLMELTCRTLAEASFYVEFFSTSPCLGLHYRTAIDLISLSKLKLRLINPSFYPQFLLLFRFPVLCKMKIEQADVNLPFNWDLPFLTMWLSRASDMMEELILKNDPSHIHLGNFEDEGVLFCLDRDLEQLLRSLPKLKYLSLPVNLVIHADTFINIHKSTLLPCLDSIKFSTDVEPWAVLGMVDKRNFAIFVNSSSYQGHTPIMFLDLTISATHSRAYMQQGLAEIAEMVEALEECNIRFIEGSVDSQLDAD